MFHLSTSLVTLRTKFKQTPLKYHFNFARSALSAKLQAAYFRRRRRRRRRRHVAGTKGLSPRPHLVLEELFFHYKRKKKRFFFTPKKIDR